VGAEPVATGRAHPFDLTGKVALVTGGNNGLGLGFATGIAQAGGDVVVWGRRADANAAAVEALREHGVRILARQVDVSDEEQVVRGMREAVDELGRLDCVVANAGINIRPPSFLDLSSDIWHRLLATNLHGAYYTLREAVRHMVERAEAGDPGGSLVVNGSLTVVAGVPTIQHYAAAKGALASVVRCIAVEYGRQGIRANMILPGRIATDLGGRKTPEERRAVEEAMRDNPIPHVGTPEDCAGIVVYLMSDASRYHTGDLITVDGGQSITLIGT
jgi:NAD(P)-dependent dehydrogenase (short-subunit alcohol dehydrogenase family)